MSKAKAQKVSSIVHSKDGGTSLREIYRTTNYGMFHPFKENRDIDPVHLRRMQKSLREKNLLAAFPILVDKDFYVLDGQHRLKAAEALGMAVFFSIAAVSTKNDIPRINGNSKNWNPMDYLAMYCKMKQVDYIKFREFMVSHDIPYNTATGVLTNGYKGDSMTFKSGYFKYPTGDDLLLAEEIMRQVEDLKTYFPKIKGFARWVMGVVAINKISGYDHNRMLQKLSRFHKKEKGGISQDRSNTAGFIKYLDEIYNSYVRNSNGLLKLKVINQKKHNKPRFIKSVDLDSSTKEL